MNSKKIAVGIALLVLVLIGVAVLFVAEPLTGVNPIEVVSAAITGRPTESHAGSEHRDGEAESEHDEHPEPAHEESQEDEHAEEGDVHAEEEGQVEAGHDDEGDAGHEDEEKVVTLSDDVLKEFNIAVETAQGGELGQYLSLPGEIVVNDDRVAHVVPRVSGIARSVNKTAGQEVKGGELMAIIESRELAEAKAAYFAAQERVVLAKANYAREERLWKDQISAERDYLDARQALAEVNIELKSAEQQLHALGISKAALEEIAKDPDTAYTRYEIRAPIDGVVIEKHMTLGENVDADTSVFTIADLSTVWVNITVYQKDLADVRKGQPVDIEIKHGIPDAQGTIAWVNPSLEESTRTTFARIVLDNPEGHFRPGLFVTGNIKTDHYMAELVVPRSAVSMIDGDDVIFIKTAEGFRPQKVQLGRTTEERAEILAGLETGTRYAATNTLTLKAQLNSAALAEAGHAH